MSLEVKTSGASMRVEVTGGTGEVTASTPDGKTWVVRPAGYEGGVVDARAPVHTTITYADATDTVTVVRDPDITTAFTSLDGTTLIPFKLSHEWSYPVRPDAHVLRAGGRSWVSFGREPFRGPWQIRAVIEGPHFREFEALVEARERIVFLHNRSWCQLPPCPAPDVIVGHVTDVAGEVSGRKDVATMVYRVQLDAVGLGRRLVVPALTWADIDREFATWADVAAANATWADVRDGA